MPRLLSILKDRNCKSQINERSLKEYFSSTVSASFIGRMVRKVGLKQRKCRFNPISFVTSIIVQTGSGAKFTIALIGARYAALSGQSMESKPFHNKIKKPEVTQLMGMLLKRYTDFLSAKFAQPKHGRLLLNILREHGLAVEDIEAVDGSYWHVNDKLEDIFPGCRTAAKGDELPDTYDEQGNAVSKEPKNAQIGMQTVFSLVTGMFKAVTFTSGTADEREAVNADEKHPVLKIMDAGYVSYALLGLIHKAGSYFMLRGKCNMTGKITACFLNNGLQVRVLRVWSNNKDTVSYLITDIPRQCFPAQYAVLIQKLRWSIELLFKCLKSGVNLRGVNTSYLTIVYTIAQASLIAAIIKYLIYLYLDEKHRYYISMYKVFVNCDPWWDEYCVNLFKLNIRALKQNFKMIRTIANQYQKSHTSKTREEKFKSLEAVIEFLSKAPIKTTIEANFSYA
ncbi:transposase [Succinatimonas hippei]|uniref:transposase n=1 Tax=Succinatimonas hippei TaxID=626938 RepID=UPI0025A45724|nr:transposase [Succinatimonas hippei]MDM8120543.1 transposase [Succinatimonas hippei]